MDLGIRGKCAVVTASSGGLGAAIAWRLAQEGCRLALFARSGDKLSELARSIEARHDCQVLPIAGDLGRGDDILRLRDAVDRTFGGADILVLNLGRPPARMREVLDETEGERWDTAYRTQLKAAVDVTQAFVPPMAKRGWGRVVGVTTASVKQPMPHHGLTTVFRAGVTGLLKHMANEISHAGVTVNTVCPGSIATEALLGSYDGEARIRQLPVRRLGTPEEFAAAVAFLASDLAGFITGVSLHVDGGMLASLN